MTTFNCEVKYRGCIQVTHWAPSPEAPRPGLIEANACVKRIMEQAKQSTTVVLSAAASAGIKCVDTGFTPPKVIMQNSVYEIAHCGVDVSKPRLFTCIVGTKGDNPQFFCHVFKCESKEAASKTTRAVAAVCTEAFQTHASGGGPPPPTQKFAPPAPMNSGGGSQKKSGGNSALVEKQRSMRRQSLKKAPKAKVIAKLTDDWFKPDMSRDEVTRRLKDARVGDFFVRESSSNPGDYAIGVQSGKQIWTGLIHASQDGYQLGNKGNDLFEELIQLISNYMSNSFMNDDFGYPLTLRMPKGQEMQQAGGGGGYAPPAQQYAPPAQQFAPPAQQYAPPAQQFAPPAQQFAPPAQQFAPPAAPSGGWPADDADDDMAEFEKFMDSAAVRGDDLVDENGEVNMAALDMAMGGASVAAPAPAQNFTAAAARAPAPMLAPKKTLQSMASAIAATLSKDAEGCMSGADVRPVLMKTGLQIAHLGKVWMDVDSTQRGKIDTDQLGLMLGLIAQVQNGGVPNLANIDPSLLPTVEGF